LFKNAAQRSTANVVAFLIIGHRDEAGFRLMLKVTMAPFDAQKTPSVVSEPAQDCANFHRHQLLYI